MRVDFLVAEAPGLAAAGVGSARCVNTKEQAAAVRLVCEEAQASREPRGVWDQDALRCAVLQDNTVIEVDVSVAAVEEGRTAGWAGDHCVHDGEDRALIEGGGCGVGVP